jgi:hypothetical protein
MADNIFPLKVATDLRVIVRKVDPDLTREERQQVEYEFSNGRQFRRYYRDAAIYHPILEDDLGFPILDDNGRSIPL